MLENESTEMSASIETDVSTADTGDSEMDAVLKEAGVSREDLDQPNAPESETKGQAKPQPKKVVKDTKGQEEDLIQKLLDEQEQGDAIDGGSEPEEGEEEQSDSDSVLKAVNGLKLVHEGEEFKVSSKEELKSLIQQGRDYTKKTQAVAHEKKEFEALKSKAYEEYNASIAELNKSIEAHQNQLQQYQIWDLALQSIKQDDPDLFDDLVSRSKQASKYFHNPVADAQFRAMNEKIAQLESANKSRESDLIRRQFDAEFGEQMTLVDQLDKELGLKIDKEKVREEWAKTGGSVSKAIGALYWDRIAKLRASKAKVNTVKAQVGKTGAAGPGRRGGSANAKKGGIDWNASNDRIVDQLAGMFG